MQTRDLGFTHRFVPSKTREQSPTLLLLHGTGGNENDLLDLGASLLPNANLLSPRGKVLERGMPRFFRRLAEGIFDEEDLILRTHELGDFVRSASEAYGFDAKNVIAVGYSNGANIAGSLFLLEPSVLAGGVLLRAMVPLTPVQLPDLSGKSVFMASGKNDSIVPISEPEKLASMLKQSGAEVTLEWTSGGHGLVQSEIIAAQAWLQRRKLNNSRLGRA